MRKYLVFGLCATAGASVGLLLGLLASPRQPEPQRRRKEPVGLRVVPPPTMKEWSEAYMSQILRDGVKGNHAL